MNLLFIGDVVGKIGCDFLRRKLPMLKRNLGADITIVNGENSADGNGISPDSADAIFGAGADIITTGNHVYRQRSVYHYLDTTPYIIRPANYPKDNPGRGYCLYDMGRYTLAVVNLMGTAFMEPLANPFETIDAILKGIDTKLIFVDLHAEATSEKLAMAYYLDGRVSALIGTHTHVQTADTSVFSGGMGYLTDVGMTGPASSVLGVSPEIVIAKFRQNMPMRFETAHGDCCLCGVVMTIDENTGKTQKIESLRVD